MANPERGEFGLDINGKEYTLRPRTNAIRDLQRRTGKTYGEILKGLDDLDMEATAQFFFAVLQPYHAKEIKSVDAAGDLMDDAGGLVVVQEALVRMLQLNVPTAAKTASDARPLEAAASGTGDASGSTPAPAA